MLRLRSLLACALAAQAALALPALADGDLRGERRPAPPAASPAATRDVDLVVCLDTSGSMQGLIDAARQKLWDVCALLAQARPTPRLRVALLQYGGDAGAEKGHVVLHADLTTDLDAVYEKLVGFQASGGDERVGRVLHEALTGLAWSPASDAVRVILVAGNESADQDAEFPFRRLAGQALQRNAVVHAIYCAYGGDDPATIESWKELARCGGGEFAPITLQQAAIQVETPYDAELVQLSARLNETYLPFGARGREGWERQAAQDRNAQSSGGLSSSAGRAACKGQSVYRNEGWDLVDAEQQEGFDWAKLKQEDLPEALRGLPVPAARAMVAEVRARRAGLQARVRELSTLRQKAIDEALAARKGEAERTLDQALLGAIKKQGQERGLGW